MSLARFSPLVLLTFFLWYHATPAAMSAPGQHALAQPFQVVSQAYDALRVAVQASPLARDTRPSPEEERRAYVALWADRSPGRRMPNWLMP